MVQFVNLFLQRIQICKSGGGLEYVIFFKKNPNLKKCGWGVRGSSK